MFVVAAARCWRLAFSAKAADVVSMARRSVTIRPIFIAQLLARLEGLHAKAVARDQCQQTPCHHMPMSANAHHPRRLPNLAFICSCATHDDRHRRHQGERFGATAGVLLCPTFVAKRRLAARGSSCPQQPRRACATRLELAGRAEAGSQASRKRWLLSRRRFKRNPCASGRCGRMPSKIARAPPCRAGFPRSGGGRCSTKRREFPGGSARRPRQRPARPHLPVRTE